MDNVIETILKYQQKSESGFSQKFAQDNKWFSFTLTSDGCFQRHNKTRDEQNLTEKETKIREFAITSKEEKADTRLCNKLHRLKANGINDLKEDETIEEFLLRHADDL